MTEQLRSGQVQTMIFAGVPLLVLAVALLLPSAAPKYLIEALRKCEAIKLGHRNSTIGYDCQVHLETGGDVIAHSTSQIEPSNRVTVEQVLLGRTKTYRVVEHR